MNITEFERRFPPHTKIGFDLQPETATWFHDNGAEVGVWKVDRRTTTGQGDVLFGQDAMLARQWYGRSR